MAVPNIEVKSNKKKKKKKKWKSIKNDFQGANLFHTFSAVWVQLTLLTTSIVSVSKVQD